MQLQGLQDMLTMGYAEATDNSSSEPMFEDLGRLHIKEGEALLLQHARSCIGQTKINRICEALTRFHFGERGQGSSFLPISLQKPKTSFLGSLAVNANRASMFGLYKEHVGYGGSCDRYPWSAFRGQEGYPGPWKLNKMIESPLLEDIDADELVHLLYTYAVLFQSEMELRGFQLELSLGGPTQTYTFESNGQALTFLVTVTAVQHLSQ